MQGGSAASNRGRIRNWSRSNRPGDDADVHGAPPPSAEPAWDDVRRATELRLRLSRLDRVRRQRLWALPLHDAGRILSLGLRGRGPTLEQQLQRELEARRAELLGPNLEAQAERGGEGGLTT